MTIKIGVLALQGGVEEHLKHLKRINKVRGVSIKKTEELNSCQGLIIPGGESSTLKKLINKYNFKKAILNFHKSNKKIWGSCAGLIILAKEIENEASSLGLLDIKVQRNAVGSQLN
ncbi:MAG: pyridoxal 5'-phosphate synthase glutaminase subunit PdxT, partial [Halanaerobium sp. MSAO_Bac5]